ncbi:MAG: DUF433 domain-containing protein [Hymenobacteraceae bacterium]|nr:DUF433 domain-containing protein [Hymenobacteraceae bacterium]
MSAGATGVGLRRCRRLHQRAVVRGLRYPVTFALRLLVAGMTDAEILADYGHLEATDLRACQAFDPGLEERQRK